MGAPGEKERVLVLEGDESGGDVAAAVEVSYSSATASGRETR